MGNGLLRHLTCSIAFPCPYVKLCWVHLTHNLTALGNLLFSRWPGVQQI
jgi:hypothetical protein